MVEGKKGDAVSQMFQLDFSGVDEPDKPEQVKSEPKAATAEDIAALQKQLLEAQKQNADLVRAVVERPVNVNVPRIDVVPKDTGVDLSDLPNPALDPEGFKKQLGERVKQAVGAATKSATDTATSQARTMVNEQANRDRAWDIIRMSKPEIAKNEKLVILAATEYAQELGKRQLDVNAELARDVNGFAQEVIKRAEKIVADIKGEPEVTGQQIEDEEDPGRAMNMLGQPHTGSNFRKAPKEGPGNLVKEIKKIQSELKLY